MTTTQTEPLTRRRRNPARPAPQTIEPPRQSRPGRVEVMGRGGQSLSRKRTGNTDPYAIPKQVIPDGWDYQWNTYIVVGEEAVDNQILMAENGWRPVPAERHAGMFMPEGHKGQILRGGMRLEERPMELTLEARREDDERAVAQIRDQNAQLGMGARLGRGFEERRFAGRARTAGDGVREGIDHDAATDAPRPRLEIDPGA